MARASVITVDSFRRHHDDETCTVIKTTGTFLVYTFGVQGGRRYERPLSLLFSVPGLEQNALHLAEAPCDVQFNSVSFISIGIELGSSYSSTVFINDKSTVKID